MSLDDPSNRMGKQRISRRTGGRMYGKPYNKYYNIDFEEVYLQKIQSLGQICMNGYIDGCRVLQTVRWGWIYRTIVVKYMVQVVTGLNLMHDVIRNLFRKWSQYLNSLYGKRKSWNRIHQAQLDFIT